MNKNSHFTKAIAAFLAVLMVFGTLVSLRGFSVQAEPVAAPESAKTEESVKGASNGHRVVTQQVKFFEWKMKDKNRESMEIFQTVAGGETYIGLWYDGTESFGDKPSASSAYTRVWLAQDQYKNPGAFQEITNGKLPEYCDPRGVNFFLQDESNYRGFVWGENYGPNKNWWLKNNTYFNANSNPWDIIEKIIYVGTEGTPAYNHMITYFRDTIFPLMVSEYTRSAYFGTDVSNGCAIKLDIYDPIKGGNTTKWIGVDVETMDGGGVITDWYRPAGTDSSNTRPSGWHTSATTSDINLYKEYLLPALVQCAIYAITSGNVDVSIPGNGTWPSSHDMNPNQKDPWNNTVARRELTRTMRTGSTSSSASVSGSYVRMIVNEILNYAKNSVGTVPAANKISYSIPTYEVGRNKIQYNAPGSNKQDIILNPNGNTKLDIDYNTDDGAPRVTDEHQYISGLSGPEVLGPNGEKYGYKGVFKVQPPAASPIKVTFQGEFYTDIDSNGSLTGRTYTPHQISGAALENFLKVTLNNGGSTIGTTPLGENDGTPWRTDWNNQPKDGSYSVTISDLNEEWVYLPGKTTTETDANGNVTITGRFVYNRTDFTIKKNWKNNITGSTAAPDGASATFQLKQNGNNYGSAQTIDGANNWTYTWTKLPKYVTNGNTNLGGIQWNSSTEAKTYVYSAQETAVSPAEWNIDSNPKTVDGILTFTNTKDNDDQVTITITQTNKWVGMENEVEWANTSDLYIPTEIGYQLYANGVPCGEPQFFTNPYGGNKTWDDQAVWNNLPKYDENGVEIVYSIGVASPDARWWLDDRIQYTKPSTDTEGVYVDENGNYRFDLTHRWDLTNIFVEKSWTKNGIPTDAPADAEITVHLMKYSVDGIHELMASVTLNAENNWKAQFMTDAFTNTGVMDPFFPRYTYTENGVEKLSYFLVEEGHDENVWTPVYPENYGDAAYYNPINNGTYTWPLVNSSTGDYSIDKTAKLTEDGTYTVTLTAQYNGYAPEGSEFDLDTYVSDTLGNDFHVASGYNKNNVKVYRQQYLGKDENGNDKWGALEAITVDTTVTTSERSITLGEYGSDEDKLGLNVKVTGFDLEQNGCYTDGNGNHGYRLVVEITKVLANGDALGDMLPLGDKPLNDPDEDREDGICGIYDTESGEILKARLRRDGEVRDDAMLIFPKPTVQIREMIQVYDFGLRQRNDDMLDFFGHGSGYNIGMGDIEHVLSIDDMYKDQTRGTDTISYKYAHGNDNDDFEVGIVTIFTGSGNPGAGWEKKSEYNDKYVWTNTASHPNGNDHSCFGYFEPKTVNANEFVVSALVEVTDNTYAWCRVKFMPATNVYYEAEQFAKIVDRTFVNNKNFANETTQDAYTVHDRYQNHSTGDLQHLYGYDDAYINGHKGAEDDLNSNAAYNAYGLSNGNALSVTLTKADYEALSANSTMKWPYVEFSFTGEAFDIIANTNATSGFITVQVTESKDKDGNWKFGKNDIIVNRYVDTRYFGAADDTVNYDAATGTMTQVPVLRVTAKNTGEPLANGSYGVRISAVYLPDLIPLQPTKGEQFITIPGLEGEFKVESAFDNSAYATKGHTPTNPYPDMKVVFDAIRVFNPHADSVAEHLGTETNGAYAGIKDIIRANAVLNPDGYGENLYTGGIYIDYLHVQDINQQTGENVGQPIIPKDENGVYSFEQYLRYGPNHEMYLKNGNAFAFVLNNVHERQSLHIAAKVPVKATVAGKNTVVTLSGKIYGIDSETNQVGYMKEIIPIIVDSATPMYYSVTDAIVSDTGVKEYSKNLVILQCTVYEVNADGTIKIVDGNPVIVNDTESILSLTGVKLVNKPDEYGNVSRPNIIDSAKPNSNVKGAESETPAITMYAEAYESAMAIVAGIKGDVDGDGRVTMIDALMAMRHALGSGELNNYGEICADIDENTVIDMRDALAIIRSAMV